MKFKNTIRLACAVAAAVASASASAQWTVYDPVNWIQNMSSANSAINNEINTAKTLIQQINSAKQLARSTSSLTNLGQIAGVDQALQMYRNLVDVDSRLTGSLDRNSRMAQDLHARYGASNMSWDQFASSRSQLDSEQRQLSRDRYAAVATSMLETTRRRQEIVTQLSQVQGQTEAMQTLGASLDVIIGQNQQIIAAMMANNKQQETKQDTEEGKQQWAENQRALYQKRLREAASKF